MPKKLRAVKCLAALITGVAIVSGLRLYQNLYGARQLDFAREVCGKLVGGDPRVELLLAATLLLDIPFCLLAGTLLALFLNRLQVPELLTGFCSAIIAEALWILVWGAASLNLWILAGRLVSLAAILLCCWLVPKAMPQPRRTSHPA
ncbi:MAG: hypothetical protein ACK45B_05995 [Limisphaerales bacterium]|jgi:hypothetical protein